MQCPECHSGNRQKAKFCCRCGHKFYLSCPQCGNSIEANSKYCDECGCKIAFTSEASDTTTELERHSHQSPKKNKFDDVALSAGERKHVTVLFSDLTGYTSMSEKLDPEDVKKITSRIFSEISKIVAGYDGFIEKFAGDAVMAIFGVPMAHEDDPIRAINAARDIHHVVDAISPEIEIQIGQSISMHTGINTGLVVTGEVDLERGTHGVAGDTINLASRLSGVAKPGEVLVSQATYRQTEAYFTFERLKSIKLKGKTSPISIFRVRGTKKLARRQRGVARHGIGSPLVGRETEFEAIKDCVNRLLDGQGGILSIIGEAGIGKSRLMVEVHNSFDKKHGGASLLWLEGRTLSYGQNISYWPFMEIIKQFAGIEENDSDTKALQKLENGIAKLFALDMGEILPYLGSFLTLSLKEEYTGRVKYLDSEAMGRQIFFTSRRFFSRLAHSRPLVLTFEDMHWIDESSMLLLKHLLPLVYRVPLLICGISRPEPKARNSRLRDVAVADYKRCYTELRLSPLQQTDSALLMQNLIEFENLPPHMEKMILRKAGGNPFFLEEIMRSLIESQALEHDVSTARWRATSLIETITIPNSIQGIIMARVDRLGEDLKQVLRSASVIGRTFLYRILQAIEQADQAINRHLDDLQTMELIREKQRIPELEYIFKHALVQESTYESILLQKRRKLHAQAAQAIETLFFNRLEAFYSMLAHHYVRAEMWEKAQDYLIKAGDQAARIAADTEALDHYRQAIETFESVFGDKWDPLQRASLDRKMGEAFHRCGEHERAMEYLQRALALLGKSLPNSNLMVLIATVIEVTKQVIHSLLFNITKIADNKSVNKFDEEIVRIYSSLGRIESVRNYERFMLASLKVLNFSERKKILFGVVFGTTALGVFCGHISFLRLARIYNRRAITIAENIRDSYTVSGAYWGLTLYYNALGRYNEAIESGLQSAKTFRETGDIFLWGWITFEIARASAYLGNFNDALAYAKDIVRIGREAAVPQVLCWGLYIQGFVLRRIGNFNAATEALEESCSLTAKTNDFTLAIWTWTELGRIHIRKDQKSQALIALEAARKLYTSQLLEPNAWISHIRLFDNTTSPENRKIAKVIYHWLRKSAILLTTKAQYWNLFRHGIAETYLLITEKSAKSDQSKWLKKAASASREALRHSKPYPGQLVEAMLIKGTFEYLKGKPDNAQQWWKRSLATAEVLGMRYEMGLANLEMGKRLNIRKSLEKAEALFLETGATWDLSQAQKELSKP